MGDLSTVDIAYCSHVGLLRRSGCVSSEHVVLYGAPLPLSPTFEVLFIDGHIAVAIVDRSQMKSRTSPDYDITRSSHFFNEHFNIPRASEKAFGFSRGPEATAESEVVVRD